MTNYELHKEEIEKLLLEEGTFVFGVVGDKIHACSSINHEDCIFFKTNSCHDARVEWLNAEYEEPITAETLDKNFRAFCNKSCRCAICELHGKEAGGKCKFAWLLKNYNVTKKEANNDDKNNQNV